MFLESLTGEADVRDGLLKFEVVSCFAAAEHDGREQCRVEMEGRHHHRK